MAEIRYVENRHDVFFFCRGWYDLDKISETGAEWHVHCGEVVEIETRCRIPIWRKFGRIQWHVIQEPPAALQGAASWRIQCDDSRATCHIAGCCQRANSMACHPRATYHIAGCCHLVNSLSRFQSHMPHCRVQSPGEINVNITIRLIVTTYTPSYNSVWTYSIKSHLINSGLIKWIKANLDRATLQGVRIPSSILKIIFAIFYFFWLLSLLLVLIFLVYMYRIARDFGKK